MFKKNTWIVGLLAALAIMFAGCVDAFVEDTSGVPTDVVKLSEVIKDAPVGVLATNAEWDAVFKDSPFAKCGDGATFEIINDGGVKKLKIWKMDQTWGQGMDIRSASTDDNKGANFKAGDKVYIKGTASPAGIILNPKGEAFGKIANWASGETFDEEFTLTADEAGSIKANGKGIRIHYDSDKGNNRKGDIVFEEIYVHGLRGSGDVEEPGLNYDSVEGKGAYMPPSPSGLSMYLDLGQTQYSSITTYLPAAKISTDKLTVKFTTNGQGIFIPFDATLLRIIRSAKEEGGYTVTAIINGELDRYPTAADNSLLNLFRWDWTNGTGGNWDMTGVRNVQQASDFPSSKELVPAGSAGKTLDVLKGIVIQARPGTAGDPLSTGPYTLTIDSIEIKFTPGTPATIAPITAVNITLNQPMTGATADTTVGVPATDHFTGVVRWYPALNGGKFDKSEVYRAEITLTPELRYSFGATATVTITVNTNTGSTSNTLVTGTFTGGSNVVLTTAFPRTKLYNELPPGVVFKLSENLEGKKIGDGGIGPELQNAGGAGAKYGKEDGSVTGDPDGIIQSGITADWNGVDIVLSKVSSGIDPALNKIKVEVTGKVLEGTAGQLRISAAAGPWNNPTGGSYENYSSDGLGEGDTFTMSVNEIAATYLSNGNGGSLRICSNENKVVQSFIITEIIITNLGPR